jgi:aldehyde dehydrogenase (NAD+)
MKANYIGGQWVTSDAVSRDINPSNTDDVIDEFARAGRDQIDTAIDAAVAAFPGWSRTVPLKRHDILKTIGDELTARAEDLGRQLSREEGKILPEGIGEVMRAGQIFQFFAGECLRIPGERLDSVRPGVDVEITREPLGVVGLITPWNVPMVIPAWKIAPALAYGNCVVFKPADLTPASAHALTEIISRAGLPPGVFNLVMGRGSEVGQAIVEHPGVAGVSFTGGEDTGRRIAAACVAGDPMKKFQLEMGGKNPLVVLDDADVDIAADCAINGAFLSTGQKCTASSRLIVTEGIHDRFVGAVMTRMAALTVDDALTAGTHIGPVVSAAQLEQNLRYVEIGKGEGAQLRTGGDQLTRAHPGYYMSPALFTEATNQMRIAREEIFGPVACVVRVKDYEEALAVANDTVFGLSAAICTASLKHATHFKRNSETGNVMVNLPSSGGDYHVAFGGRKRSSFGSREQGRYAAEFYTTVKTGYTSA